MCTHLYCCLMSRSKGCVVNANGFDIIVVVVAVIDGGGGAIVVFE